MNISVAIITDEHKPLKECLDSLKFADEVILTVTGNSKAVINVAKQYDNVKIYNNWFLNKFWFRVLYWKKRKSLFCFNRARNYSLSKCTKDWILVVDADERIRNPEHIYDLINKYDEVDVWYMLQVSTLDSGNKMPCLSTRLWRNRLGIKYTKIVHETVDENVNAMQLQRGKSDAVIEHVGFTDKKVNKEKSQRIIDAIDTRDTRI